MDHKHPLDILSVSTRVLSGKISGLGSNTPRAGERVAVVTDVEWIKQTMRLFGLPYAGCHEVVSSVAVRCGTHVDYPL